MPFSRGYGVATYRTQMGLIGDILSHTGECVSVSDITRYSRASHSRVSGIVKTLVSRGLMEQVGNRYRVSDRGRDFLREYHIFRSSSESFGMAV